MKTTTLPIAAMIKDRPSTNPQEEIIVERERVHDQQNRIGMQGLYDNESGVDVEHEEEAQQQEAIFHHHHQQQQQQQQGEQAVLDQQYDTINKGLNDYESGPDNEEEQQQRQQQQEEEFVYDQRNSTMKRRLDNYESRQDDNDNDNEEEEEERQRQHDEYGEKVAHNIDNDVCKYERFSGGRCDPLQNDSRASCGLSRIEKFDSRNYDQSRPKKKRTRNRSRSDSREGYHNKSRRRYRDDSRVRHRGDSRERYRSDNREQYRDSRRELHRGGSRGKYQDANRVWTRHHRRDQREYRHAEYSDSSGLEHYSSWDEEDPPLKQQQRSRYRLSPKSTFHTNQGFDVRTIKISRRGSISLISKPSLNTNGGDPQRSKETAQEPLIVHEDDIALQGQLGVACWRGWCRNLEFKDGDRVTRRKLIAYIDQVVLPHDFQNLSKDPSGVPVSGAESHVRPVLLLWKEQDKHEPRSTRSRAKDVGKGSMSGVSSANIDMSRQGDDVHGNHQLLQENLRTMAKVLGFNLTPIDAPRNTVGHDSMSISDIGGSSSSNKCTGDINGKSSGSMSTDNIDSVDAPQEDIVISEPSRVVEEAHTNGLLRLASNFQQTNLLEPQECVDRSLQPKLTSVIARTDSVAPSTAPTAAPAFSMPSPPSSRPSMEPSATPTSKIRIEVPSLAALMQHSERGEGAQLSRSHHAVGDQRNQASKSPQASEQNLIASTKPTRLSLNEHLPRRTLVNFKESDFLMPPRGSRHRYTPKTKPDPPFYLDRNIKSVMDILVEWKDGLNGNPSVQEMNRLHGGQWRTALDKNLYWGRAGIVQEFKRLVREENMTEDEALPHLEARMKDSTPLRLAQRLMKENGDRNRARGLDCNGGRPRRTDYQNQLQQTTGAKGKRKKKEEEDDNDDEEEEEDDDGEDDDDDDDDDDKEEEEEEEDRNYRKPPTYRHSRLSAQSTTGASLGLLIAAHNKRE